MKKKRYLSIFLVLVFLIASLGFSSFESEAKSRNVDIVLRYGKKKIVLATYKQNSKGYNKLIKQVGIKGIYKKFKVGKFYKEGFFDYKDEYNNTWDYTGWYNYRTKKDWISIELLPCYLDKYEGCSNPPSKAYYSSVKIKSKDFSLNGIKVGMSREKASKILDRDFKKVEHHWKKYRGHSSENHSYVSAGRFNRGHLSVEYKGNKVKSISFVNDYSSCDCTGR